MNERHMRTSSTGHAHWATPIIVYIGLALGLSWAVWVPVLLLAPDAGLAATMVGAFGPAIAAALVIRRGGGSARAWLRSIAIVRVSARWYAFALAVPLLIVAAQTVAAVGLGLALAFDELPARLPTFVAMAVLVFLVGGGQEEPGWRGYLLPALQSRVSPLTASVVIGVVWAVWHLPLFVLDFDMYAGGNFAVYVPTLVALAVVYSYLWNRSRGSVVVAMVMHAAINASAALIPVAEPDTASVDLGFAAQLTMGVAVTLLAAVLVARHGRDLGGAPPTPHGIEPPQATATTVAMGRA